MFKLIKCDFCSKDAVYDARTIINDCWANVCEECFRRYGVGLGLGKGQVLAQTKCKEYDHDLNAYIYNEDLQNPR